MPNFSYARALFVSCRTMFSRKDLQVFLDAQNTFFGNRLIQETFFNGSQFRSLPWPWRLLKLHILNSPLDLSSVSVIGLCIFDHLPRGGTDQSQTLKKVLISQFKFCWTSFIHCLNTRPRGLRYCPKVPWGIYLERFGDAGSSWQVHSRDR